MTFSAIQYIRNYISLFYKNYSNKPIKTSSAIDTTSPIAKLTIKPITELTKQKQG